MRDHIWVDYADSWEEVGFYYELLILFYNSFRLKSFVINCRETPFSIRGRYEITVEFGFKNSNL